MNNSIEILNLSKSYDQVKAVNNICFNVIKGEMFGLVGPDGAGKTTTIRMLCGLLPSDSGEAELLGLNIKKNIKEIQNKIGYLSQKFSLYGDLTIDENIEFYAKIHGVRTYKDRRNQLLEFTRLTPFRNRLAEKLSGGMKQKLALACSLIHKPEILFLDEPTTGVDPVSRRDFWKILSNLLKDGITIFMSTPYLDEAERCNRIALMNKGEIIVLDTPQNAKTSMGKIVLEIICDNIRLAYNILKDSHEVQLFGDRLNIIVNNNGKDLEEIKNILSDNNISIDSERFLSPSLENIFIHIVKEAN